MKGSEALCYTRCKKARLVDPTLGRHLENELSRIYVVDDEPDMAGLLAAILESEGHRVESYTDGRAALSRVLEEPPDLLLLDLIMPDLDGIELLKLLRLDARGKSVQVLIVSARSEREVQAETTRLGASAHIFKPFSPREVIVQVRQLLADVN